MIWVFLKFISIALRVAIVALTIAKTSSKVASRVVKKESNVVENKSNNLIGNTKGTVSRVASVAIDSSIAILRVMRIALELMASVSLLLLFGYVLMFILVFIFAGSVLNVIFNYFKAVDPSKATEGAKAALTIIGSGVLESWKVII